MSLTCSLSQDSESSSGIDSCIDSGDQQSIQAALSEKGSKAILCPNAVFLLTAPVRFTANAQELSTQGYPTDASRAVLRVTATDQDSAVIMEGFTDAVLRNVIIDGNRPVLGYKNGGAALIQAGGSASGQVVREVKAYEPRGWSILHVFEGHNVVGDPATCSNALVEGNEIGPAGEVEGDNWADGISFACTNSQVRNNVVTDCTDGGIVVFGAPGSRIENNTVRAQTRKALGGINLVDYGPFNGDYSGTTVTGNTIDAAGAIIRIAMAMGGRVWGCPDAGDETLHGATVTNNTLTGTMGYGFAIDGVSNWTVTGNISQATYFGEAGVGCTTNTPISAPAAFLKHDVHSQGTFQDGFQEGSAEGALWPPSDTF